MADYCWVITHVNTKDLGEDMIDDIGVAGPRSATPEQIERAKKDGVVFRMEDDDGIWCYRGKLWFEGIEQPTLSKYSEPERDYYICAGMGGYETQEFGPLYDYGMPNVGCTNIFYRCETGQIVNGTTQKVWAVL